MAPARKRNVKHLPTSHGLGGKVDHRAGSDRSGYYIRTFTGRKLHWDHVDKHDYSILDIAHSLGSRVRWSGHVKRVKDKFISIGQHSVIVHDIIAKMPNSTVSKRKQGLLHDGGEAYMPDFPSPLKWWMRACGNDEIFKLEHRVDKALCKHFDIQYPFEPEIKEADLIALATENRDFMPDGSTERNFMPEPMAKKLVPWGPDRAEREFLKRWEAILAEEKAAKKKGRK
jgi:5'-deoxynucleotidase YfbR-like HD superfamily hydrolase